MVYIVNGAKAKCAHLHMPIPEKQRILSQKDSKNWKTSENENGNTGKIDDTTLHYSTNQGHEAGHVIIA